MRAGSQVYFAVTNMGTKIQSVPAAGGSAKTLHTQEYKAWSLAADETHVYWTTNSDLEPNQVLRKSIAADENALAEVLAETDGSSPSVALDAKAVYWCAYKEGNVQVHKLAR